MSEKQQHTPRPWSQDGLMIVADYQDGQGNRHHCHVGDATNRNEANRSPSMEEVANARLMAAAPDLLAALEAVEKWRQSCTPIRMIQELEPILEQVAAAIKKARGEE